MNDWTTRRRFLRGAATGALGVSTLGSVLAACGNTTGPSTATGKAAALGPGGLPLARKDHPVTMPTYGIKPIASGLQPESGPLKLYNWQAYMNPKVIKSFESKYGVKVQVSTFTTAEEAIAKLTSTQLGYDLFWPTPDLMDILVAQKLLAPLNHSYIPNLKANVWDGLQSPWYDQGSQYTVPYTVYTTGIGWRADKLGPSFDPGKLKNPYDVFWQAKRYSGKVGLLDDMRDCIAMAILRNGGTDINSAEPKVVNAARDSLKQLVGLVNAKFDTNEYERLANGSLWLHQGWNGDVLAAPSYAPKGTPKDAIRYWWPADGQGVILNDMMCVLRGGGSPVLAHLFLDHVLDTNVAMVNFAYNYYQQPLKGMTNQRLISSGLIAPSLQNALVKEAQYPQGYAQGPLSQPGQILWQNAWAQVKSA